MMPYAKPLPGYLVQRFQGWKGTTYAENEAYYKQLALKGQHPRAMVIACCDSRVHVTSMFGADSGEFFIHRNIANLVPPYEPTGNPHGTSAAVEYAVTALGVAHVIVMGHSRCGGVQGCLDMCQGKAPELEETSSFVGRWMDILRTGYNDVKHIEDEDELRLALEKRSVVVSMKNLMTFPFVADAMKQGALTLHGLWHDIEIGSLEQFEAETQTFVKI